LEERPVNVCSHDVTILNSRYNMASAWAWRGISVAQRWIPKILW